MGFPEISELARSLHIFPPGFFLLSFVFAEVNVLQKIFLLLFKTQNILKVLYFFKKKSNISYSKCNCS